MDSSQALTGARRLDRRSPAAFADPIATVTYLCINTQEPPFDNVKVRQR
jgi:ABC-type oligopeptide transport system substrate-binding subunit